MTEWPYDQTILDALVGSMVEVRAHMDEGLPEEVVGMVLSDGSTHRLINQARSANRFEVSVPQLAEGLAAINPSKHTVIAIYHSHPLGTTTLSPVDQTNMTFQWQMGFALPWLVVTENRSMVWWLDPKYNLPLSYQVDHLGELVHAN